MSPEIDRRIADHRARIARGYGRELPSVSPTPGAALTDRERSHLLDEAQDLYWNEVEWERITQEEMLDGGPLTELAFPGFLAFVRGLLLRDAMPDSLAPANPRPEVVLDIARFLAGRAIELETGDGDDEGEPGWELRMAQRLLDLVLYQLHGLSKEDVARIESQVEH